MKIKSIILACTFAVLLLLLTFQFVSASAGLGQAKLLSATVPPLSSVGSGLTAPIQQGSLLTATVHAASGSKIDFDPGNNDPVKSLPHLILYKDGDLTPEISRTLIVHIADITVPLAGVTITIEIQTQHEDPDRGGVDAGAPRLAVWRDSWWISNTLGFTHTIPITTFEHLFTNITMSATVPISTPTDYFRYAIDVGGDIIGPVEYAFLMENQYETDLEPDGKNDYKARIHYCDMFLFGKTDPASWIDRSLVHEHISNTLAPMIQTVFDTEVNTWGFGPLHDAWDIDNVLKVVVGDGGTFSHVPTTSPMTANPIPSFSALNSVTQTQEAV